MEIKNVGNHQPEEVEAPGCLAMSIGGDVWQIGI